MADSETIVKNYMNDGLIFMLPKKRNRLTEVLAYIADKIPAGELSETDINAQIQGVISFPDYVSVRRDLVDFAFFKRTDDGRVYEKIQQPK
ncbi:DUF2087 domain-containing protein [Oenococcus sp.]|uniref:DUF2087 domain-containing protein n=1 Tax=Oenococcus sp. TaxID=1979414 RepID=UPI0039EA0F56